MDAKMRSAEGVRDVDKADDHMDGACAVSGVAASVAGVAGAVLAGASMVAGAALTGASAQVAQAAEQQLANQTAQSAHASQAAVCPVDGQANVDGSYVKVHNVQGKLSFSQDVVTPTDQLIRDLRGVSSILCDDEDAGTAGTAGTDARPDAVLRDSSPAKAKPMGRTTTPDWDIAVLGDVTGAFTAKLEDLARQNSSETIMSYTCLDNPADGRATANAGVTGVSVMSILDQAGIRAGANVVTFVSADGYKVRLPLDYVRRHACVIAYRLNGEPLEDALGCANQLWIGATAAHYFVRDVRQIRVQTVAASKVPPAPGSPEAGEGYANRPNVGVLRGVMKGARKGEIA